MFPYVILLQQALACYTNQDHLGAGVTACAGTRGEPRQRRRGSPLYSPRPCLRSNARPYAARKTSCMWLAVYLRTTAHTRLSLRCTRSVAPQHTTSCKVHAAAAPTTQRSTAPCFGCTSTSAACKNPGTRSATACRLAGSARTCPSHDYTHSGCKRCRSPRVTGNLQDPGRIDQWRHCSYKCLLCNSRCNSGETAYRWRSFRTCHRTGCTCTSVVRMSLSNLREACH